MSPEVQQQKKLQFFALQDLISGHWMYKHADLRPWDPRNDVCQYEYNYIIQTKTRHQTPMIRTSSIVSVDPQNVVSFSVLFFSLQHCSSKGYVGYSKG
jgi:hypothetical protein